jgi:hypothetical protein
LLMVLKCPVKDLIKDFYHHIEGRHNPSPLIGQIHHHQ